MTMKKFLSFIFILNLVSFSALAVNPNDKVTPGEAPDLIGLKHDSENDRLKELLAIPEVAQIHQTCVDGQAAGTMTDDLDVCLWAGVEADPALKTKVTETFNEAKDKTKTADNYESMQLVEIDKEKDPALEKMQLYFQKKLEKTLFGFGENKKQANYVDHKLFNDLYRSQVGKNIILALTSYCIEADSDLKISTTVSARKAERNTNMNKLKAPATTDGDNVAFLSWNRCMMAMEPICHQKRFYINKDGQSVSIDSPDQPPVDPNTGQTFTLYDFSAPAPANPPPTTPPAQTSEQYSSQRACEVVKYMKGARQNLAALDKIEEGYDKQNKKGKNVEMQSNVTHFDANKKGNSVDDLTTVSSNEVKEEFKYQEGKAEEIAAMKECMDVQKDPTTGNVVSVLLKNKAACEKYLAKDHTESDKLEAEVRLRAESMNAKVQELKTNPDKESAVTKYLKDQGYSEDEIAAKFDLSNQDTVDGLVEEITRNINIEKDAIIASLKDKIDKKKSEEKNKLLEGVSEGDVTASTNADVEKLKKIHEELTSDTENYTKLIHYNNIVSSYLTVTDSEGTEGTNASSFHAEMQDSAFDPEKNQNIAQEFGNGYQANQQDFKQIQNDTNIEDSGSRGPSSGGSDDGGEAKSVGKDQIDNLLRYESEKSEEETTP